MLKAEVRLAQCFVAQANADVCPGLATALGADQAASKNFLYCLFSTGVGSAGSAFCRHYLCRWCFAMFCAMKYSSQGMTGMRPIVN